MRKALGAVAASALCLLAPAYALAQSGVVGAPVPWQLGLQPGVTEIKEGLHSFHTLLLIVITLITVLVMALLIHVMLRFRASRNPNPSRTTHNTLIEVVWTVVPIAVLVVIAVPSFRELYRQERIPQDVGLTIKAIGHQWYWSYEYPDHGNFKFDAIMVAEKDLKPGQLRLLETDNTVVVPVNTNVRVLITAEDVLHSWTIPAFGVKKDAVPGRINELWFNARQEGTYYGQCSELCGALHAFMPIKVEVVSQQRFTAWVDEAKQKFAAADAPSRRTASATPAQ